MRDRQRWLGGPLGREVPGPAVGAGALGVVIQGGLTRYTHPTGSASGALVGRANTADGADWWTLKCLVFVPCSFSKVSCDHHTMGPPITHTKLAHLCRQCGKRLN